ncbi:hypothetical protein M885DRAFT_536253 [Pelagophyceae sp. CCMP2097]|nr:hypothetical protein M885DRAFT_536253 [Pelagophyceae sp. CCMP2097]
MWSLEQQEGESPETQGTQVPTLETVHFPVGRYLVGRKNCAFQIDHKSVSREHAEFVVEKQGTLTLCDLNSRFGTRRNGALVAARQVVALADGDVVGFGDERSKILLKVNRTLFRFCITQAGDAAQCRAHAEALGAALLDEWSDSEPPTHCVTSSSPCAPSVISVKLLRCVLAGAQCVTPAALRHAVEGRARATDPLWPPGDGDLLRDKLRAKLRVCGSKALKNVMLVFLAPGDSLEQLVTALDGEAAFQAYSEAHTPEAMRRALSAKKRTMVCVVDLRDANDAAGKAMLKHIGLKPLERAKIAKAIFDGSVLQGITPPAVLRGITPPQMPGAPATAATPPAAAAAAATPDADAPPPAQKAEKAEKKKSPSKKAAVKADSQAAKAPSAWKAEAASRQKRPRDDGDALRADDDDALRADDDDAPRAEAAAALGREDGSKAVDAEDAAAAATSDAAPPDAAQSRSARPRRADATQGTTAPPADADGWIGRAPGSRADDDSPPADEPAPEATDYGDKRPPMAVTETRELVVSRPPARVMRRGGGNDFRKFRKNVVMYGDDSAVISKRDMMSLWATESERELQLRREADDFQAQQASAALLFDDEDGGKKKAPARKRA